MTATVTEDHQNPFHEALDKLRITLDRYSCVSDEEAAKWDYKYVVKPHLLATRLPPPYFWRITEWNPRQRKVYDECKAAFKRNGAIVALVGPRGVGKTSIAAQLILDLAFDETLEPWKRRPPYRKANEIVAQFKVLFSDYGSTKIDKLLSRLRDYSMFDFLVIDEWHECDELKMRDRVMTDLLDRRYAHNKDTLLISNQTPDEFMDSTNESTISRLSESGAIIRCEWESFRSK